MTRTHALARVGERTICKIPHGHWKTTSTITVIGTSGMVDAASFDEATDTALFLLLKDDLMPRLHPG